MSTTTPAEGQFTLQAERGSLAALYVELGATTPGVPPPAAPGRVARPLVAPVAIGCTERGPAVGNEHFVCGNRVATPDGQLAITGSGRLAVNLATAPPVLQRVVILARAATRAPLPEGTRLVLRVLCQRGAEQVTHVMPAGPLAPGHAVEVAEIRRSGRQWQFGASGNGEPLTAAQLARTYRILTP